MSRHEQLVERYLNVWNEADPASRRATIEKLWAPDGHHYMGTHDVQGYDALEGRVQRSHQVSIVEGGNIFRLAGKIQDLPGVVKFRWEMARRDSGNVAAAGVGFLHVDHHDRIAIDYLFTES